MDLLDFYTHTLLKSSEGCFIRWMWFLVNDRTVMRPCWRCNRGKLGIPSWLVATDGPFFRDEGYTIGNGESLNLTCWP